MAATTGGIRVQRAKWVTVVALAGSMLFAGGAVAVDPPAARKVVKAGTFCETQDAKACQEAVTSQLILDRFKQGNARFASGRSTQRNYPKQVKATAAGQYPLASVVSCIDSRAPAEIVFDQGIGDLFNARVAGNIVNEDILGSLEFASKVMGSKLIVVLGHTSCGAIKGACDDVKLGNLTGLIGKIKPAMSKVPNDGKDRSSKNYAFVEMVAEQNVRMTVETIRANSPVLREMEDMGEIKIVGAMYDVKTGKVEWYDKGIATTPAPAKKKS
jgi:carbonic anhydrase